MLVINPFWWLGAIALAIVVLRFLQTRTACKTATMLSNVARGARMNYSALDRFDLATRLQQGPDWTGGVIVSDVIYGASHGERRFVATVERRATADDRPKRMVVACAENLDNGSFRTAGKPIEIIRQPIDAVYNEALAALA